MNIFVVNSGSSSIKYQLFKMPHEAPVCVGLVERIGLENSIVTHTVFTDGEEKVIRHTLDLPDHEAGLHEVATCSPTLTPALFITPMRLTLLATGWCMAVKSLLLPPSSAML
jgi:acetate kinase